MSEIIALMFLVFPVVLVYRFILLFWTQKQPQIVKFNEVYMIRRLATPFGWEYAKNVPERRFNGDLSLDYFSQNYLTRNNLNKIESGFGHKSKEDAVKFLEMVMGNRNNFKVQRVDGLWFMCKNKLSKIKFRRKSAATKVN